MPSLSHEAWIHVLPTPIAHLLLRAVDAEGSHLRLLAFSDATESLLRYLALIALTDQRAEDRRSPEVAELIVDWLRQPLSAADLWRLTRAVLRSGSPQRAQVLPRAAFIAPNGRSTAIHADIQRLIEVHHLVTENPALSLRELESVEREVDPETRLYRVIAALDPLWGWEMCSHVESVAEKMACCHIWRGSSPRSDRRPWPIPTPSVLLFHPKEGSWRTMPPFLMSALCFQEHEGGVGSQPTLAFLASDTEVHYRGWFCGHPLSPHRGLERARAFLDEYEELPEEEVKEEDTRDWHADLSKRQQEIVQADAQKVLVVAGAGSGKTRVLTYRIAYLIQSEGESSDRILAVTFTNRAAREMKHRLRTLLGSGVDTDGMWVGTFHSICLRILKEEIGHLGYQGMFSVVDREAQELLLEDVKADTRYALRQQTREQIARVVDRLAPSPAQKALRNRQVREALRLYRLKHSRALEADELIGMGIARWGTEFGYQYLLRARSLAPEHPDIDFLLECFEQQSVFQMPAVELADQISHWKDALQSPEEVMAEANTTQARAEAELYRRYQQKLRGSSLLDFGDLIMLTWVLFRQFPEVLRKYRDQFRHILVDEFQDINSAQDRWLRLLGEESYTFGVGDADQLIYEWRGANVETILGYEQEYTREVLEENYRSGRQILTAANSVIQHNALRQEKALRAVLDRDGRILVCSLEDESAEAEFVAAEIDKLLANDGITFSDVTILYRINAKAESFHKALQKREIPHRVIGGQRFYEQPEIRHALCYLRLLHNPRDRISLKQLLGYQLDPTWVAHLEDYAREQERDFFYALHHLTEVPSLDPFAQTCVQQLLRQLSTLRASVPNPTEPRDIASLLRYDIVHDCMLAPPELPQLSLTYLQHLSLEELFSIALRFTETENEQTIQAFLEYVALFGRQDELQVGDADVVTLMTMHSGKGLEFEAVFVVGCVDGLIPLLRRSRSNSDLSPDQQEQVELRQIEEERRLFYVSLTRAKSLLYLTYPKSRDTSMGSDSTDASRFLDEIPEQSYERYLADGT